jgi:hypothetical protein
MGQFIPVSIMLIYTVILFVIMIYSSIASIKSSEGETHEAYITSRYSAIISGITVLFTILLIILYIYFKFSPTGRVTSLVF